MYLLNNTVMTNEDAKKPPYSDEELDRMIERAKAILEQFKDFKGPTEEQKKGMRRLTAEEERFLEACYESALETEGIVPEEIRQKVIKTAEAYKWYSTILKELNQLYAHLEKAQEFLRKRIIKRRSDANPN